MKMDIAHYSGGSDDGVLSSLEWTDDDSIALNEAVFAPLADGKTLIPAGVNKHFHMIAIIRRFQIATKKKVEAAVLWRKLYDMFDITRADSMLPCPFPNEPCDFTLPDADFSQLIRDRKNTSVLDKLLDDESRDSGSGRETPPTLPIAKRGAAVQSSNKRKYSSSISETGSEPGGGRKSTGTPTGTGASKGKRRI